jgi:CheY-like chemotaxis protein
VRGACKLLERLLGEDVELVVSASQPACTRADPGQIEQVIMNLAINARDAMPEGGRLTIETGAASVEGERARAMGISPGPYATIRVRDTGTGMDDATRARLFEPFFTTKPSGKGTGLGLATVYGIVKQSGGGLEVTSELGRGSAFVVFLPAVNEPPEARERPEAGPARGKAAPERRGGDETVLVVEDEGAVRRLTERILLRAGYKVHSAANGEEALRLVESDAAADASIEMVLSDVIMPGMNGRMLSERLHALRPELPVVFMSGYTDDVIASHGMMGQGARFLAKPFTPETLRSAVRAALDRRET